MIDPIGIDRLLSSWRDEGGHPFKTPVNHDSFVVSLGNVCRWLVSKVEALGIEIYPDFAAADLIYNTSSECIEQGARCGSR